LLVNTRIGRLAKRPYVLAALLALLVVGGAALLGWIRGDFDPRPTPILSIAPGLTVLCGKHDSIRFTGVLIYKSGEEVLCMSGNITTGGAIWTSPPADAFLSNATLRLRFEPSVLGFTGTTDAVGSNAREISVAEPVAEFLYHGETQMVLLKVKNGRISVVPVPE